MEGYRAFFMGREDEEAHTETRRHREEERGSRGDAGNAEGGARHFFSLFLRRIKAKPHV
jgi:hypothetical protein